MPANDFTTKRLFVDASLKVGTVIDLDRARASYLLNVLRLVQGTEILVFNGLEGEWIAEIEQRGRKNARLNVVRQTRPQTPPLDLHYVFAPIKQARMEYMVQKAVEMGVGVLQPVLTEYTQLRKLNLEKMGNYVTEAAEQCGVLAIPEVREPIRIDQLVDEFDSQRVLVFCNEHQESSNPLAALDAVRGKLISVLIGPEGGFSAQERDLLMEQPFVAPISLGPRILRADTAAVAAFAIIQATIGDWREV